MNELPSAYQNYIHLSRYSRFNYEKNRRESWPETVDRYMTFFKEHLKENHNYDIPEKDYNDVREGILTLQVLPSMRALMSAGPALKKDNTAGFNCAFTYIDDPKVFSEILNILMCGTGIGFSVERQAIAKLPEIPEELYESDTIISVRDSKIGWSTAYDQLIRMLFAGHIPKFDTTKVRAEGTPLKTFGGRASGPEPLERLFKFTIDMFTNASGRKLTSVECHDLVCMIANIVVVGGVRRSALISLSNLSDERMRSAKSGEWWNTTAYRSIANNSAAYTETPDIGIFMKEWLSLYESKSGERGIFNREASKKRVKSANLERANFLTESELEEGTRDPEHEWGTNPCSEIILRNKQFCNLSVIVARKEDDDATLAEKARLASIIGTWQSTLTKFRFISKKWTNNTEEERLLGVSICGMMDSPLLSKVNSNTAERLQQLKQVTVKTNFEEAKKIGINPSKAVTCVKPDGTTSQLVDGASGIHSRYSPYYVRRVRNDMNDPLSQLLIDQGVPHEIDIMNPRAYVFSFPIKSPKGAIVRDDVTAIEQLKHWMMVQDNWCEHKPSVTINVKEHEWMEVGSYVYEHFDNISGISFLPHDSGSYQQAPYEEIDKEKYNELVKSMPQLDWEKLPNYESSDMTEGAQELACSGASGCDF